MTTPRPDRLDAASRRVTSRIRLAADIAAATRWAERALRCVRRDMHTQGLDVRVPIAPRSRLEAGRGVQWALRIGRATCLERSLILQAWLSAQGIPRTVVVGVSTDGGFSAHAWLDGEESEGHEELTRIEPAPFPWEATAYSLLLDHMAEEVVRELADRGVDSLVLKGPTFASWLWPDDQRGYGDIDLLVAPGDFSTATAAIQELGFVDKLAPEDRPEHATARPFVRADSMAVDLHRGLIGVGIDPAAAWEVLSEHRETVELGGVHLPALDETARLLHVALHAAQHIREAKPRADLERALTVADLGEWQKAADLGRRLQADRAFTTGLQVVGEGRSLARSLELGDRIAVDDALRLRAAPTAAHGLERLSRAEGLAAKANVIGRAIVPTPKWLRQWTPLARRGRAGLVAAYVWRMLHLVATAPASFFHWARARWSSRAATHRSDP